MRLAFYFDQSRCMGCNSCSVSCKDYNGVNPGNVRYRRQNTHETTDGFFPLSMACNHCVDPACMKSCGAGAITKRSDGIVTVNRNKCQSLKSCISACPFAEPGIADDKQETEYKSTWKVRHPMQKCDMCKELLDKGETPVCVRACPAHALKIGDFDELLRLYPDAEELSPAKHAYAYYNNQSNTKPSFLIKPRKPLEIK